MKKNNILIVHPISQFSGSLKSIEQYVKLLKKKYNFFFIIPSGEASQKLKKYGNVLEVFGLSKFDNSQLGHYRKLRWLLLIREIFLLFPTFLSVLKIKKKINNIDLIHFNEITLLPTIYIYKLFFNVPFILHCRILFKKDNFFGKKIIKFLKKNINEIIAIDNDVKKSLPSILNVKVVRNILIKKKFNFKKKKTKKDKVLKLGYLGTFLKYKGLEDLIKVINKLNNENYLIRLYLGGNFLKENMVFKTFKVSNNIDQQIINSKNIINLGHITNLNRFYQRIDILCFPSYLNALGRQVFEAGLFRIPSIVCLSRNKSDSFVDKLTGLSFNKPGSLKQLGEKIKILYFNRKLINKMGLEANKLITKNFKISTNLKKLQVIYKTQISYYNPASLK